MKWNSPWNDLRRNKNTLLVKYYDLIRLILYLKLCFHLGLFHYILTVLLFHYNTKKHQRMHLNEATTKKQQRRNERNKCCSTASLSANPIIIIWDLNCSCAVIWTAGIRRKLNKLRLRFDSPPHYLSHSWKSNTPSHPSGETVAGGFVGPQKRVMSVIINTNLSASCPPSHPWSLSLL